MRPAHRGISAPPASKRLLPCRRAVPVIAPTGTLRSSRDWPARADNQSIAIERERHQIGCLCFSRLPLKLQDVPELQMRIGSVRVIVDRGSIGNLRRCRLAGFLERMAILHPDRRVAELRSSALRYKSTARDQSPLSRALSARVIMLPRFRRRRRNSETGSSRCIVYL